jgi:YD repeat-containing protein
MALSSAGFPTGLQTKYSYAWTDPAKQRLLFGAQPVLKALDVSPGGPSPDIHLEFEFKGGYFNAPAREFRGFGEAIVNYPATDDGKRKLVQIAFHQGASPLPNNDDFNAPVAVMKGRPYAIITSDDKGVKYASATTTYLQRPSGGSVFIAPSEVSSEQCEGACYLTLKHQFAYDELGNMKQETFHRVSSAGSSSLNIDRTYLENPAGVLGLVSSEKISDGVSGAVHSLTTYRYDQTVACGQDLIPHAAGRFVQTSAAAVMEDGRELVTWSAYDQYGNIVCRQLPEGGVFRTQYDPTGNWPRKMTNALGFETRLEYYGVDGADLIGGPLGFQKRIVDANGDAITSEYDELGRKTRETMPADVGGWTAWNYIVSAAGQTIHSTDANGDETYETRDGFGRLLSLSSRGPDLHWIESSWTYDGAANLKSARGPALREVAVNTASFKHDLLGRAFETIDADGATSTTCFLQLETVRLSASGDLLGQRKNEQGLIAEVFGVSRLPNAKPDCSNVFGFARPVGTRFDYDSAGRMVKVTRNGRVDTTIAYNRLGSIALAQDRNNGNTAFSYDLDGRTTAVETEGGVRKYITYDRMGRPAQYDFGSRKQPGSGDIQYYYDDTAPPHGRGRLSQIAQGEYKRTMSYDSLGNVLSEIVNYGARELRLERKYDFKRRLTFLSALGQSYVYKYEGGLLREIAGSAGPVLETSGLSLSGQATSFQIGNDGTINLKFASPHDGECAGNISRLCKIEVKAGDGAPLFVETYGYDAQGRIKDIEQPTQRTTVTRDELGRLIKVQNSATPGNASNENASLVPLPPRPDEEFKFDTFGRLQWSKEAGDYKYEDAAYAVDGPRAVGNDEISYRADGKVTAVGARRITHDERGLISEVNDGASSASFKYDPEGRLLEIAGTGGSTQFFGDSFMCSPSGCQLRLRGLGPLLISASQSEARAYGVDALGSPRMVVGKDREGSGGQSFTAYGRPLGSSSVDATKLGMGQNSYSSEASLYLLGDRGFDAGRHLFLGPDPRMTVQGANALSGRYVYGYGDPFTYEDRNGQIAWFVPIIVGAILGATAAAVNGDNVLKGAAMGAIGGAFYWVGMEYLGGGAAGFGVAGAASGATNAALFGGDVGQATFNGAFVGAVSGAIFSNSISVFGNETGLGGSIDYTINATVRGAAAGGGYAAFTGDDVGKGALRGAAAGAVGAAVNMFIGHSLGAAMSGFKAPSWRGGAWEYDGGNRPFTIGNVIVGAPDELAGPAYSGTSRSLNAAGRSAIVEEHEFGHIPQSQTLGLAYLPAVGLSYLIGGAFGALTNSTYQDPTHAYSPFENDSGFISVPDFL